MTKLALLLDECVQEQLANEIKSCPGISSFERIDASHELCSRPDDLVMAYAIKHGKILVTVENRINEDKYTICTHPGIIVIHRTSAREFSKGALFSKFMQSGERKHAKHAVTHLRANNSIVKRRDEEDGIVKDISLSLKAST